MTHASNYVPAYDLAGNLLFQYSNEAGLRWMLPDISGQPLYTWDMRDNLLHTRYDQLRRPVATQLYNAEHSAGITVAYIQYGDENGATLSPAERQARQNANLLGQVYRIFDQSGMLLNQSFDFKGLLLANQRRLLRGDAQDTDWSGALDLPFNALPERLQGEENFVKSTSYDALGRMIELKNWQLEGRSPAIYTPSYNQRGALLSEKIQIGGIEKSGIQHIGYNAKGQRTHLRLGNGTHTNYIYDKWNFRLQQLRTSGKNGEVLQDLSYTYDPVGNICSIVDAAQDTLYFRNRRVEPRCRYTYDALYRLIAAEGREHLGPNAATATPQASDPWASFHGNHAQPGDGNAMGTYLQRYTYDATDNILSVQHQNRADIRLGYTRHYQYETRSNRLLATQINGNAPASAYADAPTLAEPYAYNAHGSMTRMPHLTVMDWDFTEHLAHIGIASHPAASPSLEAWYRYDTQKQRSYKKVLTQGGTWEERLYLEGYELYRRYGAGAALLEEIETHHLFDGEQRVLLVEDVRLTDNRDLRTGSLYRYQYGNHLGSVALECDDTGRIVSYEEYHPYGTTAYQAMNTDVKAAAKRYRYTGMERDEESGLAYHTARYYLAWLGRWGSCDPMGLIDSMNLFLYAKNNVIRFTDQSGNNSFEDLAQFIRNQSGFDQGKKTSPTFQARSASIFGTAAHKKSIGVVSEMQEIGFVNANRIVSEPVIVNGVIISTGDGPGGAPKGALVPDLLFTNEGIQSSAVVGQQANAMAQELGDIKFGGGKAASKYSQVGVPVRTVNGVTHSVNSNLTLLQVSPPGNPLIASSKPYINRQTGSIDTKLIGGIATLATLVVAGVELADQIESGQYLSAAGTIAKTGLEFIPAAAPVLFAKDVIDTYQNSRDIKHSSNMDGAFVEDALGGGKLGRVAGAIVAADSAVARSTGRVVYKTGKAAYQGGRWVLANTTSKIDFNKIMPTASLGIQSTAQSARVQLMKMQYGGWVPSF